MTISSTLVPTRATDTRGFAGFAAGRGELDGVRGELDGVRGELEVRLPFAVTTRPVFGTGRGR